MDIQDQRSNRKKTDIPPDFREKTVIAPDYLEWLELDLQDYMTRQELNELVCQLSKMPTVLPDDRLITETMERLQMEQQQNEIINPIEISPANRKYSGHSITVWKILKVVISHIGLSFLWQSLVFYLTGFFLLHNTTSLPRIFILPVIAAIPFLLGVISILRRLGKGMSELLMSLKYKLVWFMNASFLLTGVYCLLINTLFTFVLTSGDMNWGLIALHWCTPSIVIASIAVWLCAWVKDFLTLVGCFISFPILCMLFYSNQSVQILMISLSLDSLMILFTIAILLFIFAMFKTTRHIRNGGMINGART